MRKVAAQQILDLNVDLRAADIETADVDEPDYALLVDEHTIRHHVEIEQSTQLAGAVDHRGKRHIFHEWKWPLRIDVDRDAQEREVTSFKKLLPHGQLLTASSPAGPHEHQQTFTPVIPHVDRASINAGQRNGRQWVSNVRSVRNRRSHLLDVTSMSISSGGGRFGLPIYDCERLASGF
jgi:hypothetical protein